MSVESNELDIILNAMEEYKAKEDQVVIKEGDPGNCLYVVDSGKLICTKQFVYFTEIQKNESKPKLLKEYHPGEAFGELALLYNTPRAATITAKSSCILWKLDRETFNYVIKGAAM